MQNAELIRESRQSLAGSGTRGATQRLPCQNGACSEAAQALGVAETGPEATERVRKLPKGSSGEGGWRISSQDFERTGSKSV